MRQELLERFLKYVQIYTPSDETSETTPSTRWQFDLANALKEEMDVLGITGAYVDENCYVYGYLPATEGYEDVPAIAFIAHMDTVSDFCEKAAVPVIHEDYNGEDIILPEEGRVIKTSDFPHLKEMKGRTIITADGTTVLGADDKAGIAEIVTMAEELIRTGEPHGKICMAFTPDEEIGSGAGLLDLDRLGADFAFTLDGGIEGGIEYETFNAASAKIHISGVNVHPGSAKDIMVNAGAIACEIQAALPEAEQPRNTSGYEGFYHLISVNGTVEKADLVYIIRDHDRIRFEERKENVSRIVEAINVKYGEDTAQAVIKDSYYNMAEILKDHMDIVESAKKATEDAGLTALITPVRGGTDGSALSFRGLPCPNLGTGGAGYHGPFEHISLEGMERSVEVILNIVKIYSGREA